MYNLLIFYSVIEQMLFVQFQQCGFAATPDTGQNLYNLRFVFVTQQCLHIGVTIVHIITLPVFRV
jgi:hypothetical protein